MALNEIQVHEFPSCDLCGKPAPYDVKTTLRGQWGNLCVDCFKTKGTNQGSKRVLIVKKEPKRTFDSVPIVSVPLSMDSLVTIKCAWCDQKRRVETDANYVFNCEGCGKPNRCRSAI